MPDWIRHPDPRIYGWIPAFAGMTSPICKYVTELANKTTKAGGSRSQRPEASENAIRPSCNHPFSGIVK
jgi:hypothetical protein